MVVGKRLVEVEIVGVRNGLVKEEIMMVKMGIEMEVVVIWIVVEGIGLGMMEVRIDIGAMVIKMEESELEMLGIRVVKSKLVMLEENKLVMTDSGHEVVEENESMIGKGK